MVASRSDAEFREPAKDENREARHIPLNAVAIAAFEVLQKRSVSGKGEVFVNIQGEALHGYKHWFDPAVEEARLKDFTWYCLQHTFASRIAMAGVDLLTISELMGHKAI